MRLSRNFKWERILHIKNQQIQRLKDMFTFFSPEPTEINDEKNMEIEIRYCRFFGCGERLSLIESLCGDFCERHMNLKPEIFYNGLL